LPALIGTHKFCFDFAAGRQAAAAAATKKPFSIRHFQMFFERANEREKESRISFQSRRQPQASQQTTKRQRKRERYEKKSTIKQSQISFFSPKHNKLKLNYSAMRSENHHVERVIEMMLRAT